MIRIILSALKQAAKKKMRRIVRNGASGNNPYLKILEYFCGVKANNAYLDQKPRYAVSDQDLHCFP